MSEGKMIVDPVVAKEFVLAGNARVTLRSKVSGDRFSYRVKECDDKPGLFFVSLLTQPDNENGYQYLGIIRDGAFAVTRKSRISAGAPAAMGFAFFWERLQRNTIHKNLEVWHEGHCGRCGRTLTVPESIERGIGPECASRMGVAA